MPAVRRQALHRRALHHAGRDLRGTCGARGDRVGRLDRVAAAARALRHRPGRSPQGARHRGAARSARRRREPARPLGAAHEVARRPAWRDLQRARARPSARCGRGCSTSRRARGSSAIRRRRCAPSSRRREGLDSPDAHARAPADAGDAGREARKEAGHHHHHAAAAPGEQGQRSTSRPRTRASRRRSASTFWPSASTAIACSPPCASRGG